MLHLRSTPRKGRNTSPAPSRNFQAAGHRAHHETHAPPHPDHEGTIPKSELAAARRCGPGQTRLGSAHTHGGGALSLVPRLPPLGTSAYCSPTATSRCKSYPRICSASPPRCAVGGPAEGTDSEKVRFVGGEGRGVHLTRGWAHNIPVGAP